jgi:hypothetical protein
LYKKAQTKLILMRRKVLREIRIAFNTSSSRSFMATMPAALTVMSEAELIATPTSA